MMEWRSSRARIRTGSCRWRRCQCRDPLLAARELEYAITSAGLYGAAVCTHVCGIDLDDAKFAPVFACAERLGVPIFLHPQNTGDISRMDDFHLWNVIGF